MSLTNQATLFITFLILAALTGCSSNNATNKSWNQLIPEEAPAAYTPANTPPIDSILTSPYIPFLNDITASSVRLISELTSGSESSPTVKAIYLFPSSANQWKPVWIAKANSSYLKQLQSKFEQPYTQNEYHFMERSIHIFNLEQRKVFATKLDSWILFSENSLALEESIRSYTGRNPALNVNKNQLEGNKLVLNTPFLDQWVKQLIQVTYRPSITGIFDGSDPIIFDIGEYPSQTSKILSLTGILPVKPNEASILIESVSTQNENFQLHESIPDQAASYGIFHLSPSLAPPTEVLHPSKLDSILQNNTNLYQRLANSLHSEFAISMFAESGYLSSGEHFFLRRMSDKSKIIEVLQQLEDQNRLNYQNNIYTINSRVLAELLGSSLCNFNEFYLGIVNNALVLSKRKGLTESVISDTRRNRVVAHQKMFQTLTDNLDDSLSALVVAESRPFLRFIESYLAPNHYVDALLSQFDLLSLGFKKQSSNQTSVNLSTFKKPETTAPYRENWTFSLSGTDLSGQPILADIGGSPRNEIIFASRSGNVHALASDGTEILQTSTGTDTPVGSPMVYDWYRNGQNIILQAAGNKIYGWNTRGNILPQFPLTLDETISAQPRIADVNRDGMPELIVATTNREIHVLNGRGNDIPGWPQKTNSIVNTPPVFKKIDQYWSVVVFAANTVHAWLNDGSMRPGYPTFIQATFRGQPAVHDDHIFGNAADGRLYAIAENPSFSDSLRVQIPGYSDSDSLKVTAVNIADGGLTGTPTFHELPLKFQRADTIQPDSEQQKVNRDTYILTSSSTGSIYFVRRNGSVQQSYTFSQTIASDVHPFVGDLEQDGSKEVLVTSRFGRLFAWNLNSGKRSFTLPTQSMQYPILTDIDRDGNPDLIAQYQNGVRCWTLLNP